MARVETMPLSWFLALLVAALTAWMIRAHVRLPPRVERSRPTPPALAGPSDSEPWQALRLVPGAGACAAARAQAAQLYPPGQAPITPLTGCGGGHCQCHYETVHERRRGERRSGYDRRTGLRYEPDRSDRRARNERRHSQTAWSGLAV